MYYQNVRQTRERLPEPYVYVTSLKTPNGGREGVVTEVETALAARMIVDGSAREATAEEIAAHLSECERLRAAAQEDELRSRLRVTLVNEPDIRLETGKTDRGTRRT
jgi:hypothetical protein